jgi:hypothetical protein
LGEWVAGVRIRARVPRRLTRGDHIQPSFEVEFDAKSAEQGTTHFVANEFGVRTWLVCTDRPTGRVVNVEPFDEHMPNFAGPEDRFLLTGSPPPRLWATYYLSTVWDELPPGAYDARLEFRDPRDRPRRASDQVGWQPPRVWTGTVSTASFSLVVVEAPPEALHLRVPRRLTLRSAKPPFDRAVEVAYDAADAAAVDVSVHHGFDVGGNYDRNGDRYMVASPPQPDDDNAIDVRPDNDGSFNAKYTIGFSSALNRHATCGNLGGSKGWHVLWTGTLP